MSAESQGLSFVIYPELSDDRLGRRGGYFDGRIFAKSVKRPAGC